MPALEPIDDFIGVPIFGLSASDRRITDDLLLQQIVTAARMLYFVYGNEGVRFDTSLMRENYGALLVDIFRKPCGDKPAYGDELAPLFNEARNRAEAGSEQCASFVAAVDWFRRSFNREGQSYSSFMVCEIHKILEGRDEAKSFAETVKKYVGRCDPDIPFGHAPVTVDQPVRGAIGGVQVQTTPIV